MRLLKSSLVAGVPAPAARTLMRAARMTELYTDYAEEVLARAGVDQPARAVRQLVEGGYLDAGMDGHETVTTTTAGNAVAMATFARPITRATADRLVHDLLDRAAQYNQDRSKPRFIRHIRLFGSYLDTTISRLGDLDVELTTERRNGLSPEDLVTYGQRSGKPFANTMQELFWPDEELRRFLAGGSRAYSFHLHEEGIEILTDQIRTVFTAAQGPETAWARGAHAP